MIRMLLKFQATNNEGEYEALVTGLRQQSGMPNKSLRVKYDSELIVNQVKGEYATKGKTMKV